MLTAIEKYKVYDHAGIQIYNADCRDILPHLDPVDLVLTDPPYGIGKEFENDSLSDDEMKVLWQEVFDTIKTKNLLVEVPKNKDFWHTCFVKFKYEYCMALITSNAMRQGKVGYNDFSLCLWYSKNGKCHRRYKDGITVNFENTQKVFAHPSPKQVKHYERLIDMFSEDTSTILDPFMGSGTTLVAAKQLGRKAIGIEIERRYVDIAINRLSQEVLDFGC